MPSGYTTALPTNIAIGVGVLYYNGTTVFGVSDGGITVRVTKDSENLPFDNKGAAVEGLDVDWSDDCIIAGEFIEIKDALFATDLLEPGATPTTAGTPTTVSYQPVANRTLFASGDYIPNMVYELTRGDTKKVRWVIPKAVCRSYEIVSQTRAVTKVRAEWHSVLASADAATSTDKKSYKIEVVG